MSTFTVQYSIPEIVSLMTERVDSILEYLLPNGVRANQEWCVGSLSGEPGHSLKIHLVGEKTGVWKDFATGESGGDLVELWHQVRKVDKPTAFQEIREYLGLNTGRRLHVVPKPKPALAPPVSTAATVKPLSREYHQTLRSNLQKNANAMAYLTGEKRGLTASTIEHYGLGLSGEYTRSDGVTTAYAIVAPMRSISTGQWLNKTAYITVPGVTKNPIDENGWMKGSPQCYYSDVMKQQSILFVCEGLKDVWRHWEALVEADMADRILLVSSTHGSGIPEEWKNPSYWSKWQAVYLGQDSDDAGDTIAERVLEYVGREAHRIRVPAEYGKDWTDFWQQGGTTEEFHELLDNAPVASATKIAEVSQNDDKLPRVGRFSHKPVDVNGAYVNGYLYYPTETHVIKRDEETGQLVERLETIVIRSDRSVHRSVYAPAPAGTPLEKRVLKLTDGTVIEKEPRASSMRSWDFESINAYLNKKSATRSLKEIVNEIIEVLRQAIWLPYDEDYSVLALTVPVTYLQSVFESVPLLLLNGPAGSGKSQTGNTMAKICANGVVVGQVSAAAAARLIDQTRGFVVLDDVEAIAAKAGKDVQITEFVQALKVSYNKHTGVKFWTDVKTMKTERLDFFGVKMLNNTLGADSILGTRMIRIQTRKIPDGMKPSSVRDFTAEEIRRLQSLRNELHTYAFDNVERVDHAYREVYSSKTDRQAEIAAPLRTMAKIVGDPSITTALETSLARQHIQQTIAMDDPVETLKEAVRNLIKQGFDTVTLTHLRLEMRALLDANYGMSSTTEIPEWNRPEWLGRQLRSNDLVSDIDLGRKRVYGKNLRLVRFSDWIVDEVVATHDEKGNLIYRAPDKAPDAFCQGCQGCPYRSAGCELQEFRQREEARNNKMRVH
ncbi:MAG: DUF3631 domain-containing protein [Chlorobium sp.]|nr:DUF3631 domain-containing protein [Chlorobium sp.]